METLAETVELQPPAAQWLLEAPVVKVTLFEDRAQARREGKIRLPSGSHRVKVADVSPVIADRSVVARGTGLRVDEARVVRRWRIGAQERPGDAAPLAAEHARLSSEIRHKQELHGLAEQRRVLAQQASQLLIEGINRELPFVKSFVTQWPLDLESFFGTVRELDGGILDSSFELRELHSRLQALDLRLHAFGRVDHVLATDLEVEVTCESEGDFGLSIEYMVPCALWRPIHRATLALGKRTRSVAVDRVYTTRWECEGAVWQATGEDWRDVELWLSTARPTQRSEPPVLYDDLVRAKRKVERKIDVAVREEVIADTGEAQRWTDLPGVDDGGETRLLGAAVRATILSDGRLYRIPVFTFDCDADVDRISRPELTPLVHLRSKQVNTAKGPLLAGPVELLRDSGYVGRGTVDFVAPGETFAFGWGAEDAIRVKREVSEKRETAKLTGKQTVTRMVQLFLSNLDAQMAVFKLEERIPVSEIEAVTIVLDAKETSPAAKADEQGVVVWNVEIPPHGTQKVKLVYRITAGSDVRGL